MRAVLRSLLPAFIVVCACAAAPAHAFPLIRDAEIEHTLRLYTDPILRAAGLEPQGVQLFIVNDDAINAFVAGGSNIFLHTGLIVAADTPDMLIGAIAHETGHIAGGHLARGTEKLKDAQIGAILTYVLGAAAAAATRKGDAAAAIITGGQSALNRHLLSFTRANEQAADQAALGYLDRNRISASGLLKLMEKLRRNEHRQFGSPDPYALTHPLSIERISHVRGHLMHSSLSEGQVPAGFDALHQRMIAKLRGFLDDPLRTLARYPESDGSLPARMARAVAWHRKSETQKALKEADAMLASAPKDAFLHDLKGQILFEGGKVAEARAAYKEAVRLMPENALLRISLAETLLTGDGASEAGAAVEHLEKAASADRTNARTWRLLATAYGKQGRMGMSRLALAEEALLRGDEQGALAHADGALELLKPGEPSRLRAEDVRQAAERLKQEKEESESVF